MSNGDEKPIFEKVFDEDTDSCFLINNKFDTFTVNAERVIMEIENEQNHRKETMENNIKEITRKLFRE